MKRFIFTGLLCAALPFTAMAEPNGYTYDADGAITSYNPSGYSNEYTTTTTTTTQDQQLYYQGQPATVDGNVMLAPAAGGVDFVPNTLEVKEYQGVRYVTGGVGDEEKAQLKSLESQFTLAVLMTAPNGAFLGNARIDVIDKSGASVLSVGSEGPQLLAALPAGTYTVGVEFTGGERKSQKVTVGSGLKKLHFISRNPDA